MRRLIMFRFLAGLAMSCCLCGSLQAQTELGLAEIHGKEYPTTLADEEFARLVHLYSQGSLKISVFPGGEITGNERTAVEMVQKGTIAFARVSSGVLGAFNARLNVFGLPYLFESKPHMWAFLDGTTGRKMLDELSTSALIGLCWYDAGARSFYSKTSLRSLDDLQGLKVRTHDNPLIRRMVQVMGATPVPMGTGQIRLALETGMVDAAENNPPSFLALEHYRIARYYLLNEHLRLPEVLFMSKVVWDRLDAGQQSAIRQAARESVAYQRARWDAFEAEALEKLRAAGVTIVEAKDHRPFKRAVRKLLDEESPRFAETLRAIDAARPDR